MAILQKVRGLGGGNEAADRPDPEALTLLLDDLKGVRQRRDDVSYRTLASLTGLSAATISRIFNASKPPKWSNLRKVLDALEVPTAHQEERWHPLWFRAVYGTSPADEAASAAGAQAITADPQKTVCRVCGVDVKAAYADLHESWHKDVAERVGHIEQLLRLFEQRARRSSMGRIAPPGPAGTSQTPSAEAGSIRRAVAGNRARGGDRL